MGKKLSVLTDSILFVGLTTAFLAMIVLAAAPRQPGAQVAVVFPPWMSSATAVARATAAGATLVRFGRVPFVLIIRPTNTSSIAVASRFGAWLVIDAANVLGCSLAGGVRT